MKEKNLLIVGVFCLGLFGVSILTRLGENQPPSERYSNSQRESGTETPITSDIVSGSGDADVFHFQKNTPHQESQEVIAVDGKVLIHSGGILRTALWDSSEEKWIPNSSWEISDAQEPQDKVSGQTSDEG